MHMLELINKFREYLDYIEEHYLNIQKAHKQLLIDCAELKEFKNDEILKKLHNHVLKHDLSKLSSIEFTSYRRNFFKTNAEKENKYDNEQSFNRAWNHHLNCNEHHWQSLNKLYPDGAVNINPDGIVALLELVIDWTAMGYKFNDTASQYYEKNKKTITLPNWALSILKEIFNCLDKKL